MNERELFLAAIELFLAAIELNDPQARAHYLDQFCAGDPALRAKVESLLEAHEEAGSFLEEPVGHGVDATFTQAMENDPNAGTAHETSAAGPAHSAAQTRADAEANAAVMPGPVPDATERHGNVTGKWTPNPFDPDETTDGSSVPRDLTRETVVRYFGDYEIQKELGRGGMGVVYKARQVSLNRPVALKLIKAGVLAGDAELQRFQNEAEAVALLDHPGIVPVYEIGEHDGQRYFSMKLVEGGDLADQIASFQADPRAAANLLAETAEAVHHAHMRGILHRDLKPANILIDAEGHPHVTDFGLAKRVEGDVEMTASGAILGTPAYMSPEQAYGRRGSITTATDVYGLGAILYALLTGKAPFGGDSVIETLDAVRNRPPEPPRKLNVHAPHDLETICLKCLEKDPGRRYGSAHALADDLHHWLESRPITARRVGATERAWLWCKRKPAVAALAAATLMAVVAGTTGIIAVQAMANVNLQSANTRLDQQRTRAEVREQQAIDAVKKFRDAVADNPELKDSPSLESLRKTLLKEPLAFFRSLRASLQADRDTRPESLARLAKAMHDYAHLTDEIGDTQDGLRSLEESVAIWEKLVANNPLVAEYQSGLALVHHSRGNMLGATGQPDAARHALEASLAIFQTLASAHPSIAEYQRVLATSQYSLGKLLMATGQTHAARKAFETALAIRQTLADAHPSVNQFQSDLSASHCDLGYLLIDNGQTDAARKAFETMLAICQKLADAHPSNTAYQNNLVISQDNLALLLRDAGQIDAARKIHEATLLIRQKLADAHPSVTIYQRALAGNHERLVTVLTAAGQTDAARKASEAALAIRQKLADAHPSVTQIQSELAVNHENLGLLLSDTGHPDAALKAFEAALAIRQKLADAHPSISEFQSALAGSHGNLGVLLSTAGQTDAARKAFEATLAIFQKLADAHASVTNYQRDLAGTHDNLGNLLGATGQPDAARKAYEAALAIRQKLADAHPSVTRHQRNLATNHGNLGKLLSATGQPDAATKAFEAALPIQERLAREHPESPEYTSDLAGTLHSMALIDVGAKRFDKARDRFQEAIVWQKKALAANPRNPQYREFVKYHLKGLIVTSQNMGRADLAAAAQRELDELNASDPNLAVLDARLAAVLRGESTKTNAERMVLAQRAYDTTQHAAAAKLWAEALEADPKVADDRQAQYRYNAACAATLAGCGQGTDNPAPDNTAKAKLRQQALDWLKAELAAWTKLLESGPPQARPVIVQTLLHWKADTDLAGIREPNASNALADAEREPWRALWAGVDALVVKAQTAPAPAGVK
jgi:tetratricopeptide (TPR) repeat protein/predicted Ser/Thr protein kinase